MKKRLQKILAPILMGCILAGMLPAAMAESAQELVDAPVITASKTPVTGRFLKENGAVYVSEGTLQTETRYNAAGYMLYSRWYDNGECTSYTIWDYDTNGSLILIRYANAMESGQVKLLFENTYSDGQLVNVQLYNILGTLLGEGPTAADAADAAGMRMMVEQAMPY